MTPNIHDLDGPLRMGDAKQIAAMKALEAGGVACCECGKLCDAGSIERVQSWAYCRECYAGHCCQVCGAFYLETYQLAESAEDGCLICQDCWDEQDA